MSDKRGRERADRAVTGYEGRRGESLRAECIGGRNRCRKGGSEMNKRNENWRERPEREELR